MTALEGTVSELQLVPPKPGRLGCAAALEDGVLKLQFSGNGELPDQGALTLLLQRVHAVALKAMVPRVVVDFDQLRFMNSSCFKAFVSWLALLESLIDATLRYRVHFKLNPVKRWQRVSVSALACFAVDRVSFE